MSTNAAFGFSGRLCIRSTSASRPPAEAPMPTVTKGSLAEAGAATGAGAVSAFFTLFFTEVVFLGIGGRNYPSSAAHLLHRKGMPASRIVVVGASAGGVEALSELVSGLPSDSAAPMLIVLHIPAESPSLLARILERRCALPVMTAENGMRAEPGNVYVAPPDRHLLVDDDGTLQTPRGPRENSHRPAVDPLFRSAAVAYGANTIGVVLTGTRDDGTSGLNAIKQCGGIAVVQDPNDAAFPSMPKNALEHVQVDHVAAMHEVAPLLVRLVNEQPKADVVNADFEQLQKEKRIAAMTSESL